MTETGSTERILAEIGALRQELADLQKEQRALAEAVNELTRTFKGLAIQLGVAADPYQKGSKESKGREIPGFG